MEFPTAEKELWRAGLGEPCVLHPVLLGKEFARLCGQGQLTLSHFLFECPGVELTSCLCLELYLAGSLFLMVTLFSDKLALVYRVIVTRGFLLPSTKAFSTYEPEESFNLLANS